MGPLILCIIAGLLLSVIGALSERKKDEGDE
jgi:hypothetical protein